MKKMKQPALASYLTSPKHPSAGEIEKKKKVVVEEEYWSSPDSPVASKSSSEKLQEAEYDETMRLEEEEDGHDSLTAAKRRLDLNPEEEHDSERTKKQKAETGKEWKGEQHEVKKSAFQRLWSEGDEIVLLQKFIDFREKNGADPLADPTVFHDFIKKFVVVEFETKQMVDKIRKMKSKYMNHMEKKGSFSPHQVAVFKLCKMIWGDAEKKKKMKPVLKADVGSSVMAEQKSWIFLGKASIQMGYDEAVVKAGLELCNENAKAELEWKWQQLYMDFLEKKLDLIGQESEMVTQALKGK